MSAKFPRGGGEQTHSQPSVYILREGEMPFNIFADEGPADEVFERTENVNTDSIICETLTILV